MSKVCDLTGKTILFGHNVSHANNKTNRRFMPNLQEVKMLSDALGRQVSLRVSTRAIRTVDAKGGLDAYLMQARDRVLSKKALRLKRDIAKKLAKAA
jgi:large subunit ribosomal protein L28